MEKPSLGVILGSAYQYSLPERLDLEPVDFDTEYGVQKLYRVDEESRYPVYLLFRHEVPHRLLPNQIPYRRQAAALSNVECRGLVITSSVGVLNPKLPLFKPMLLDDIMMMDNRLPDGSACTMFETPSGNHGHLVLSGGLLSDELNEQLMEISGNQIADMKNTVFAYVGGPRGKTAAENRMWRQLGADVNSMTLAPETVLANECKIPCAGLVVGHKYSVPEKKNPEDSRSVEESLERSREGMEKLIVNFIQKGEPVPFKNYIYRFDHE